MLGGVELMDWAKASGVEKGALMLVSFVDEIGLWGSRVNLKGVL